MKHKRALLITPQRQYRQFVQIYLLNATVELDPPASTKQFSALNSLMLNGLVSSLKNKDLFFQSLSYACLSYEKHFNTAQHSTINSRTKTKITNAENLQ